MLKNKCLKLVSLLLIFNSVIYCYVGIAHADIYVPEQHNHYYYQQPDYSGAAATIAGGLLGAIINAARRSEAAEKQKKALAEFKEFAQKDSDDVVNSFKKSIEDGEREQDVWDAFTNLICRNIMVQPNLQITEEKSSLNYLKDNHDGSSRFCEIIYDKKLGYVTVYQKFAPSGVEAFSRALVNPPKPKLTPEEEAMESVGATFDLHRPINTPLIVLTLEENGRMKQAGLNVGNKIIKIDANNVSGQDTSSILAYFLMRTKTHSQVNLLYEANGSIKKAVITF